MTKLKILCGVVAVVTTVSGCVTARLHSETELNSVATGCGLALGELMQDEGEKRLLFLMRPGVTPQQRSCVYRWARKNHLHLAVIEAINFPAS